MPRNTILTCVAAALWAAASACSQAPSNVADSRALGIQIPSGDGQPPIEMAVLVHPPVADEIVAPSISSMVATAVRRCATKKSALDPFEIMVAGTAEGGQLTALTSSPNDPFGRCVTQALDKGPLPRWDPSRHTVKLQIRSAI